MHIFYILSDGTVRLNLERRTLSMGGIGARLLTYIKCAVIPATYSSPLIVGRLYLNVQPITHVNPGTEGTAIVL